MSTHGTISSSADMICFSHLRWGFVFQRPQHLMTRFAQSRRIRTIVKAYNVAFDGSLTMRETVA